MKAIKTTTDQEFENGHLNDDLTARYADAIVKGEISDLPEQALRHVEVCMDCKDRILELSMFLRNPDSVLHAVDVDTIPLQPRRKWYAYPIRLAALFAAAALLLGTYFFVLEDNASLKEIFSNVEDAKQVQQQVKETTKEPPDIEPPPATAANANGKQAPVVTKHNGSVTPPHFRVNPNLESMLDTHYRSTGIQIISPVNNSTFNAGSDIHFAWKPAPQGSVTLKIINNKNEVAYDYKVSGGEFVFNQKLAPGLYYWKLENQKDLLCIGKFLVKR
jgi:hypothetical protein